MHQRRLLQAAVAAAGTAAVGKECTLSKSLCQISITASRNSSSFSRSSRAWPCCQSNQRRLRSPLLSHVQVSCQHAVLPQHTSTTSSQQVQVLSLLLLPQLQGLIILLLMGEAVQLAGCIG